jgi:hypothetical protein
MMRIARTLLACGVLFACEASTAAFADNLAGFFIGGGVGYSTIRSDEAPYGLPGYFNDSQVAWKAIAGVRPLPFIGAEYEYIDFGQPDTHGTYFDSAFYGLDSHPRANVLFAVGYLPLPLPNLDIFGKAGVARLETNVTSTVVQNCTGSSACEGTATIYRHDETNDKLAYGVGIQSKFWGLSFRAEYERISSTYGDPDALTVSATWTF